VNLGGTTWGVYQQEGTQIEHWWQVGVPHLYSSWLIINFVLKFMLEIIFVNMTKEMKDTVKRRWI